MTREKELHSSRPLDYELPQPKDPFSSLPNTCVRAVLKHFTAVELIGMRRVSRGWKDTVDWTLASIMRKCRPELEEGAGEEQATLEFRRDIFRQKARDSGRPAFVRRFTQATQGFAMCGDYFCWIDNTWLNVQPVFSKSNKTGSISRIERYRLTRLLGVKSLSVETIKPQEVGSITDQPLLMIKMAVICVKSGTVLWSTAHDNPPHSSIPRGKVVTLNHTTLAYITQCQLSQKPTLYVRDVLTGEIKATKTIPDAFLPFLLIDEILIQLHPRRDLVYIAVRRKAFFFSTTTANCVGRLSVPISSVGSFYHHDGPPRLRFSEYRRKCGPSDREKLFLFKSGSGAPALLDYCFEYEIPTDEDVSISEARILQNGDQGSEENLIFELLRIQIYEHRTRPTEGPPELNPTLKQEAHTQIGPDRPVCRKGCTQVRFHSYTGHRLVPASNCNILLESGKRYDDSIPAEFYPRNGRDVLVTKPKGAPAHLRRHNERVSCIIPKPFIAPITLTERYMLLAHGDHVYLFSYEPRW